MTTTKVHLIPAIMHALIIIVILCLTALAGYVIGRATAEPAAPAKQTTSTETITLGDVKRYCITIKTGDHIDAIDCQLIDPMTGQVL